jgi:hypothetical protein
MAEQPIDPLYTVHDLTAYGLTPVQARNWFNRRLFPLTKLGRLLYVRRSDFEAYLDAGKILARDPK